MPTVKKAHQFMQFIAMLIGIIVTIISFFTSSITSTVILIAGITIIGSSFPVVLEYTIDKYVKFKKKSKY